MQRLFILSVIFLFTIAAGNCTGKKKNSEPFKGRLEIKAICMNYTIALTGGNIDTSKIVTSWTDEVTNRTYKNVFALANPCNFPSSIKEGDEFYFVIDTANTSGCAVCLAYYPTPGKKLSIKIIEK
ncbi:MAG: hypothetical protein WAR78_15010 [Ferruginibacter sp.]